MKVLPYSTKIIWNNIIFLTGTVEYKLRSKLK